MTAQHAKFQSLAAFAPDAFHTSIALNRMTKRAAMRDFGIGVARTKHFTAGQHHRRSGRHRTFDFWDGDFYICGFDHQFHIAQAHSLARLQHRLLHTLTIHERAVGGIEIVQKNSVCRKNDVAVIRRNRGMFDRKVTLRIATEMVHTKV